MAVNFTKNQDEITEAWRKVVDNKDTQGWALFGYEANTNVIIPMSSGSSGLKEMVQELNCSLIQYAFCRVIDTNIGLNKLVLINWQGDSSPLSRKGLCASHLGDVTNYFKGCTQTITIRNDDESTPEYLMSQIIKTTPIRANLAKQTNNINAPASNVGSAYRKTDIQSEISSDRKSFWQRQEEEEKMRLEEEKKRALEKQAQFERERRQREESEAKKMAETIKERDRVIEATRQAERRESSGSSQPSSILSSSTIGQDNDSDERVGRRSELIRLERNQETLSLIEKGSIKNKRAIFEQATQLQKDQNTSNNTTLRPSGTIVSQRLNTFRSLDSAKLDPSVQKITNGLTEHVIIRANDIGAKSPVIKKEEVNFQILGDQQNSLPTHVQQAISSPEIPSESNTNDFSAMMASPTKSEEKLPPSMDSDAINLNGNNNHISPDNNIPDEPKSAYEPDRSKSKQSGTKARAMYDYEAADSTEISFDPNDIIGDIEKVDSGWWQGSVLTGRYKGKNGLFPANYVEELEN